MNKKKIGAIVISAVLVLGIGSSLAYFNSTATLKGQDGSKAASTLVVTNGNIIADAQVTGTDAVGITDWSYDVVRTGHIGTGTAETNATASPDINAVNKDTDTGRAVIGSPLPTDVKFARPGDAIVLGHKDADGTIGFVVTNKGNLTAKMKLRFKNDDNAKAMLTAMQNAGWKLYVNGNEIENLEKVTDKKYNVDLGTYAGGATDTVPVDIRFELPLTTPNSVTDAAGKTTVYQSATNTATGVNGINLSGLVEVVATQENNPGWSEAGN